MQQLLARALRQVANRALGNSILEMGVHAAKGELLSRLVACLSEGVVLESAIVAMIVQNFNTVVSGELLEGTLGLDGFVGRKILHQMDKLQAGVMVNEDGGALVAVIGEFSCHLCIKTDLR